MADQQQEQSPAAAAAAVQEDEKNDVEQQQQHVDDRPQLSTPQQQQQQTELGYRPEDRSQLSKFQLFKQLVLPFLFYDLSTPAGRRQYCDLVTEDPLSSILTWVPFFMLLILAQAHTTVAIWIAVALNAGSVGLEYYHATYKTEYPKIYWLSGMLLATFVAMGIANGILTNGLNANLISPIAMSALVVTAALSFLVCHPFSLQMAQHKVDDQTRRSAGFRKLCFVLCGVWIGIFGFAAVSSWVAYLWHDDLDKAGRIVLGTVLPLALILGGIVSTKYLVGFLKEWLMTTSMPANAKASPCDRRDNAMEQAPTTANNV